MNNISFEEGYKEFAINNDENRILRFNPSDIGLIDRIKSELEKMEVYANEHMTDKDNYDLSIELDQQLRSHVNEMFYEGADKIIFADQNVMTTVNGVTIFERFFRALLNTMEPYVKKEDARARKRSKNTGSSMIGSLPKTLTINDRELKIDSNFKTALLCMEVYNDPDLSDVEKRYLVLDFIIGIDNLEEGDLKEAQIGRASCRERV